MKICPDCCGGCKVGGMIDLWGNITLARPAGDSGGTHYTVPPYPRQDPTTWDAKHDSAHSCLHQVPGFCGVWLNPGDFGGVSEQAIDAIVDDIMACGADDATHVKIDHNCYFKTGLLNMVPDRFGGRLFGFMPIAAQKMWHGIPGAVDRDDPAGITAAAFNATTGAFDLTYANTPPNYPTPYQQVFRTLSLEADATHTNADDGLDYSMSAASTSTVGRLTGAISRSGTFTATVDPGVFTIDGWKAIALGYFARVSASFNSTIGHYSGWTTGGTVDHYVAVSASVGEKWVNNGFAVVIAERLTVTMGFCKREIFDVNTGATILTEESTFDNTSYSYSFDEASMPDFGGHFVATASAAYSDSYSADACKQDFRDLLNAWDTSDLLLAMFRTDEKLALVSLCIYDEFAAPVQPDPNLTFTMDDFAGPQNMDSSWPQIAWHDPNDCYWEYNGNTRKQPGGWTGGAAVLHTGTRTGTILAYTKKGAARHFWAGSAKLKRIDDGMGGFIWVGDTNGEWTPPELPPVTMRWMDQATAQYDGANHLPTPGNFQQSWWSQKNGIIRGAKCVQSPQNWKSVNFGRPCGPDKYAVDQTTVCCITTNAAPVFTVELTAAATAPPNAGDYILAGLDGVYHVDSRTGNGPSWVLTCTRKDDAPAVALSDQGVSSSTVLGKLRWPSAPGICGRAAITTSFDAGSGLLSINSISLPYLHLDPATGNISVDLCDASMTVLDTVNVTRDGDTAFHLTHAALPAAIYMKSSGVDWTKYGNDRKLTGVYLSYTFNARAQFQTTPPAWFAGTPGCISGNKEQFTYSPNCKTAVGILPIGYPENFPEQTIRVMDFTAPFDDVYGAHWQGHMALTMTDPFWQTPYTPSCEEDVSWNEDDGSGNSPNLDVTPPVLYYAHHPVVEALAIIPAGMSLPAGVALFYGPDIAPPLYPNGIPIGPDGEYGTFETDWGFTIRACDTIAGSRPFFTNYAAFIACPS